MEVLGWESGICRPASTGLDHANKIGNVSSRAYCPTGNSVADNDRLSWEMFDRRLNASVDKIIAAMEETKHVELDPWELEHLSAIAVTVRVRRMHRNRRTTDAVLVR